MSEELVNIEVDGRPLKARKGSMLIEATDSAGIYIPRFCYHKKLSIAANCRMCLVQVEKAPKPLPACATPVMEGMKVQTRSPAARDAQKATMEFLLINHPLDCPICDQGGECELQDLAMGYGADVSRYAERKRVVRDQDIGPLVQMDMTRCIHCTRCVRFGEEIAGVFEIGGTGRGEHTRIGTYVERALTSELSGNIIDVCPVGALTSKPFRFSARAWELKARPGVAPHDGVGSNVEFHVKGNRVKRVVPRENEAINEVWISDRDRFSYEGLYAADRLTAPMIRENGQWRETDWDTAIKFAAAGLKAADPATTGVLAAPTATVEELYLLQKLARALGINNLDHRLRQADFHDDAGAPALPRLGVGIADLERVDAALIIGADIRRELPMANHRLRKAGQRGARLMVVNPVDFDFNWPIAHRLIVAPSAMTTVLAGVLAALTGSGAAAGEAQRAIAAALQGGTVKAVLLGEIGLNHPHYSVLRALAQRIAEAGGATFGILAPAANSAGAWLAGMVPHQGPMEAEVREPGRHARDLLELGCGTYVLYGVEPERDTALGSAALRSLNGARFVLAFTAFRSEALDRSAHVMLPLACYAENEGALVNVAGLWQDFAAAVTPPAGARQGWRVLRVLANELNLPGFDYMRVGEVGDELRALPVPEPSSVPVAAVAVPNEGMVALERQTIWPMQATDSLVRRAPALQRTADGADGLVRMNGRVARNLGVDAGIEIRLVQGGDETRATVHIDERIADDCVVTHGGGPLAAFGTAFGPVTVEKA
jgi:NADH-quinone oxidoreductase subunit G